MKGGYHGYLKFVLDEIYPEWHLSPFSTQPFNYLCWYPLLINFVYVLDCYGIP